MAELVLRTQEHLSFKVLFFSEYTYHVVKDLVSADYQHDSTMIDEEEDLENMKNLILDLSNDVFVGNLIVYN